MKDEESVKNGGESQMRFTIMKIQSFDEDVKCDQKKILYCIIRTAIFASLELFTSYMSVKGIIMKEYLLSIGFTPYLIPYGFLTFMSLEDLISTLKRANDGQILVDTLKKELYMMALEQQENYYDEEEILGK